MKMIYFILILIGLCGFIAGLLFFDNTSSTTFSSNFMSQRQSLDLEKAIGSLNKEPILEAIENSVFIYPPSYHMEYSILKQDGVQSLYNVNFIPYYNLTDGMIYYSICHQINQLSISYGKEVYNVPSEMPVYKTDKLIKDVIKPVYLANVLTETETAEGKFSTIEEKLIDLKDYKIGDKIKFCTDYYNPYKDVYIKIGDNSTIIVASNVSSGKTAVITWNMSVAPDTSTPSSIKHNWDGTNYTLYNSSLVGYWAMNNFSALGENYTHIKDLSKYGNNGTVINATWNNSGKIGGGYSADFSKADFGYISVSHSNSLNVSSTDKLTISLWLRPNSYAPSSNTFSILAGKVSYNKYGIILENNGLIGFSVFNESNGTDPSGRKACNFNSSSFNPLNTWTHVASTYSNETGVMTNYVNGIATKVCSVGIGMGLLVDTEPFEIKRRFNGTIDEVMIWNRPLSALEISQLYATSMTKYDSQNWTYQINETNLTDRTYTYYACIANSSGSENCSSQSDLLIDTKFPKMNITYPRNITYAINVSALNYTFNETNPDSCWYSINNGTTNSTRTAMGNNFTGISSFEGSNLWWLYCNDTTNNTNTTKITFNKDTVLPTWNNLRDFSHTIYFTFSNSITASDISGIESYWFNDTTYFIINRTTGLITNNTPMTSLTKYLLNISVNDTVGNLKSDIFYIDVNIYTAATTSQLIQCRYKKLGYHNVKLPWMKEVNCI